MNDSEGAQNNSEKEDSEKIRNVEIQASSAQ